MKKKKKRPGWINRTGPETWLLLGQWLVGWLVGWLAGWLVGLLVS